MMLTGVAEVVAMCERWNTTPKLNNFGVHACSPITEENRNFNYYHIGLKRLIRNCCYCSPFVQFSTAILDVLTPCVQSVTQKICIPPRSNEIYLFPRI
jgi:hypothetical protein